MLYWVDQTVSLVFSHQFSSIQLLSCVPLFVTPWIVAHQASLSITNSMDMSLSKLWEIVKDMEPSYAAIHGVVKSQTQWSH